MDYPEYHEPPFADDDLERWVEEVEWAPLAVARPAGPGRAATLVTVNMASVTPQPVDWLWEGWLARGKLHILGGHPGDGKSTLAMALAATLSTGGHWPDGAPARPGRVMALIGEDGLGDTVGPRLALHGAAMGRIDVIRAVRDAAGRERAFDLSHHHEALEEQARQADLLIIDPLTGYMTGADRNAEGSVRDTLTPLAELAERAGIAILAIMHVGKPSGVSRRPLQQLLGATAFGALARIVWMVAPIPGEATSVERRVLAVVKSNLAIKPSGLLWSRPADGAIHWHGEADQPIEALLRESAPEPKPRPRDDARDFLLALLKDGPVKATDVATAAEAEGISNRTLGRASRDLKVEKRRVADAENAFWLWSLPALKSVTPIPEDVALLDEARSIQHATPISDGVAFFDDPTDIKSVTSLPNGVALLAEAGSIKSVTPIPEEVAFLDEVGRIQHATSLPKNMAFLSEPNYIKSTTSLSEEVVLLNEPANIKSATSLREEVTLLNEPASIKSATSLREEVTLLDEPASTKSATSLREEVTLLDEPTRIKNATSLCEEVALLDATTPDPQPAPPPVMPRDDDGSGRGEPDSWASEPIASLPATLPRIRDILRITDGDERRRLLRRHPVTKRLATINWCTAHNARPAPDAWADLVLMETDATTPSATGDQQFCVVCAHLLPLPEDRARGHHTWCVA